MTRLRFSPVSASVPWDPTYMTTRLWLELDDAGTITEALGKVTNIADKSGNGYDAIQTDAAHQGTWDGSQLNFLGVSVPVHYDISGEGLNVGVNDFALYCIGKPVTGAGWEVIFAQNSFTKLEFRVDNANRLQVYQGNTAKINTNVIANEDTIMGMSRQGSTTTISVDGKAEDFSQTAYNYDNTLITMGVRPGASLPFGGTIKEVIITNERTQREKIEGYLAWKYGLVSKLPIGHPYKTEQPYV